MAKSYGTKDNDEKIKFMYIINMYIYSKDGVVKDLNKKEEPINVQNVQNVQNVPTCSSPKVTYESHKKEMGWLRWLLLFLIIVLGVYLLCTSYSKKSKRSIK